MMSAMSTPVYEQIGRDYNANRRADPRVVRHLLDLLALLPGARIADIGAGTGNYSNALGEAGLQVIAIEPSRQMRAQSLPHARVAWLAGVAEALPLRDSAVDAVVTTMTLQHLKDLDAPGREMARIAPRGPTVVLCVDPRLASPFWFQEYFPGIRARMFGTYAPLERVIEAMSSPGRSRVDVVPFPLPADFSDMNMHSGWNRPEIYLDGRFRRSMSPFALASANEVQGGVERLRADLASGAWDAAYGKHRTLPSLDLGFRFVRIA
jgi:ubiquinone/menaquinone biosynthesis C-methylase UbiE